MADEAQRGDLPRLIRAGLLTAVIDGLFSSVLSAVFYGSTVTRLFQGVASTLLGPRAFEGGFPTTALEFSCTSAWRILSAGADPRREGHAAGW